jgi:hypothetical protein
MQAYPPEIEARMLLYYQGLDERSRRHYASLEAQKLGYGGKKYIGQLLGISQGTLRVGDADLADPARYHSVGPGRIRRSGGGRKKICSPSSSVSGAAGVD